jgi:hypothetical protein
VHYGGIFSDEETKQEVLTEIGKTFKVKLLGKLENCIECNLIENEAKDIIWTHQPKMFKHLEQTIASFIKDIREYKNLAAPGTTIMHPQPGDSLNSPEQQKLNRFGVGMLLDMETRSRPDISNATRELSKVGDGATKAHWK